MMEIDKILNTIIHGDCLEIMKQLPDKCVDVSFTSPPYNDTGTENESIKKHNTHKKYLYVEQRNDWYEWICECINEMRRITKKYVLINIQGIKNNRKDLYKIIGKYSDYIHDIIIWYKPNGAPTSTPHKLSNKYEMVLIIKSDNINGVNVNSEFYTNVIVKNINSNREYSNIHKAVMSKPFCDEIIKEFTYKNDIVFDPFFGMGTTGVSCIEQKRNYIGCEIVKEYVEEANKRLKETERLSKIQPQNIFDILEEDYNE